MLPCGTCENVFLWLQKRTPMLFITKEIDLHKLLAGWNILLKQESARSALSLLGTRMKWIEYSTEDWQRCNKMMGSYHLGPRSAHSAHLPRSQFLSFPSNPDECYFSLPQTGSDWIEKSRAGFDCWTTSSYRESIWFSAWALLCQKESVYVVDDAVVSLMSSHDIMHHEGNVCSACHISWNLG